MSFIINWLWLICIFIGSLNVLTNFSFQQSASETSTLVFFLLWTKKSDCSSSYFLSPLELISFVNFLHEDTMWLYSWQNLQWNPILSYSNKWFHFIFYCFAKLFLLENPQIKSISTHICIKISSGELSDYIKIDFWIALFIISTLNRFQEL